MVGHRFPSMTRSKVGIVVPPHYFDTTSTELTSLCAEVDVLHTQIRVSPDFGFTLDEIVQTGEEISDCAASLVAAGAEVVLQMGTPFSTAHGWSAGQELQRPMLSSSSAALRLFAAPLRRATQGAPVLRNGDVPHPPVAAPVRRRQTLTRRTQAPPAPPVPPQKGVFQMFDFWADP